MPIEFTEQIKRQRFLILIFLIILLIIGLVIWRGFFAREGQLPTEEILKPPTAAKKIEIDFQVLKNPILEEFQPFEEIIPFEEKTGRGNPFISY